MPLKLIDILAMLCSLGLFIMILVSHFYFVITFDGTLIISYVWDEIFISFFDSDSSACSLKSHICADM